MSIVIPNPPDLPGDGLPTETAELAILRRQTSYFIDTQPRVVDLVPRTKIKTASGGYRWAEQPPRGPQRMRLIEPTQPGLPLTGADGVVRETQFILLGEWDAIIGRYDLFELDDRRWEVAELYHFNGWERRAAVIAYG